MRKYYTQDEMMKAIRMTGIWVTRQSLLTWRNKGYIPQPEMSGVHATWYSKKQVDYIYRYCKAHKVLGKKELNYKDAVKSVRLPEDWDLILKAVSLNGIYKGRSVGNKEEEK